MVENSTNFYHAIMENFYKSRHHPQYQVWLDYALSTNQRGRDVVDSVRNFIPSIKGKKHLDVGCGYGGTCISFAQAGAFSIGIDIAFNDLEKAGLAKRIK